MRTLGRYRLLEKVAGYGPASWFKAHDPETDRLVTLEVVRHDETVPQATRARIARIAAAWARLSHPNLVKVLDFGQHESVLFIALEPLQGEDLKRLIAERRKLSLGDRLSLVIQVCDGLHHLHQHGIVHRDVKPAHVFVLPSGQAKITRFELATMAGDEETAGTIVGTLRYMPPEQTEGRADHRSDLYSVGAVCYELLAYRPALDTDDPLEALVQIRSATPPILTDVAPEIPADLADVVQRALEKDPARRFASIADLREQLRQIAGRLSASR
jgi:eukaryotic-like serine/threonine-protein kinase